MPSSKVRYDCSGLDAVVRKMIINSLEEANIVFELDNNILSVHRKYETVVDDIIATWETWGEEQRALQAQGKRALQPDAKPGERFCENCGSSPAAPIRLRRQVGLVFVRTFYQSQLVLCDTCGQALTKEFQKQTALKGWTGVLSAMINPFMLAANARQRSKHRQTLKDSEENG